MTPKIQVALVPWDPQSLTHRQCLIKQRDECGWDQDKVEGLWKDLQIEGYKCIYWIVSVYRRNPMIIRLQPNGFCDRPFLWTTKKHMSKLKMQSMSQRYSHLGFATLVLDTYTTL